MAQGRQQFEDPFLHVLCEQGVGVSVYLVNGIKLQGNIVSHDEKVILLGSNSSNQMIYKHAVSTVVPSEPVDFEAFDQQGNRGAD